ncbi:hypothetical protein JTP64_004240 [Candida tropicalis]|nr:hypothetical protein JTP64_004240 [Candida tropicalis]MCP8717207.1 hypothetical protein [Asgard group archaeon]
MKPVVSTFQAYCCFITSSFAIVILSIIGYLFKVNNESFMGSINDPEDGESVAKTIFSAVFVYLAFFVFCGLQIFLIKRQNRIQL